MHEKISTKNYQIQQPSLELPLELQLPTTSNRYLPSALHFLNSALSAGDETPWPELAQMKLTDYIDKLQLGSDKSPEDLTKTEQAFLARCRERYEYHTVKG